MRTPLVRLVHPIAVLLSVPTPLAGAVYILERTRVHAVDVPFTQAIQVVSRWGHGAGALLAAKVFSGALSDYLAPGALAGERSGVRAAASAANGHAPS